MPDIVIYLLIFLAVDAAALLIFLIFHLKSKARRRRILHFGDAAEKAVADEIERSFPRGVLLNDIYLPSGRGTTQIDHILICKWGVFVIETKSHNGRIVIGENEWVQHYGDKVVRFHSPVKQNEIHAKAIRSVLSEKKEFARIPVQGLIVFTSKRVSFSRKVKGVIKLDRLNGTIKTGDGSKKNQPYTASRSRAYLSADQIEGIQKLLLSASDESLIHRRQHDRAMQNMDKNF